MSEQYKMIEDAEPSSVLGTSRHALHTYTPAAIFIYPNTGKAGMRKAAEETECLHNTKKASPCLLKTTNEFI